MRKEMKFNIFKSHSICLVTCNSSFFF